MIPRQCYVVVTKRAKYVPINEDVPEAEIGVKIAPRAAQIIPKSIAHSSLLAAIVTGTAVAVDDAVDRDHLRVQHRALIGAQVDAGVEEDLAVVGSDPILAGEPAAGQERRVLTESARIARGETPAWDASASSTSEARSRQAPSMKASPKQPATGSRSGSWMGWM